MDINIIIVIVMACFAVFGAVDRIFGNKLGAGNKFEEGFMAMGPLAIAMVGILVMAPVIARVLSPVVVPVFESIGADPSLFAGIFLATDMGGTPLAEEMAKDPQAALFSGLIVGSMLGTTIVFTIPMAFEIAPDDKPAVSRGVLIGLITIPLGCLAGGAIAGFNMVMVVKNTIPVTVISLLIALGMWKKRDMLTRGFIVFGKIIMIVSTVGLILGILDALAGFKPVPDIAPISSAFKIVANIAIVLAGAFPMVHILTRILRVPLMIVGEKFGMNREAAGGLLTSLANSIPTFEALKSMNERGKVVNMAFAVSGAFILGDHLGFVAGYNESMLAPLLLGKLVAAVSALIIALITTRDLNVERDGLKVVGNEQTQVNAE
ncbi:MAG: ethanolamine utilization protein EutH [Anaerovoracaceae bacterium]|jgi:ethanolamine transporter